MMDIVSDAAVRRLLPLTRVKEIASGAIRHGTLLSEYSCSERMDLFKETDNAVSRAFRLKVSFGSGRRCSFVRVSSAVVNLLQADGTVFSRRSAGARESGLVYVYCLQSGKLALVIEDAYLWSVSLAISVASAVSACLRHQDRPQVGVIGAGCQARLQIALLNLMTPSCRFYVFHPTSAFATAFCDQLRTQFSMDVESSTSRATCDACHALIVATSASAPETPLDWPIGMRVISVTRASEVAEGIVRGASLLVAPSTTARYDCFSDESAFTRLWASRRKIPLDGRLVSLREILEADTLPYRVLFACFQGFNGGPFLPVFLDYLFEDSSLVGPARGHSNSTCRPS